MKRIAFGQYFSLVKDMREYEKDHYEKFTALATSTVNNVMDRNILKLEFSNQIITKEEPPAMSPSPTLDKMRSLNKKGDRVGRPSSKRPFQRLAKLVGWMAGPRQAQNEHLAFAEKIIAATKSTSHVKVADSMTDFSIQQAKCMFA